MSFLVTRIRNTEAAKCCRLWHYSKTIPGGSLLSYGVVEDGQPIGAVIYGGGANSNIHKPFGLARHEVVELVRVALRGHKAPVSQIIAVTLRMLHKDCPSIRLVVSYADTAQGHHGGIYKAGGWSYLGESASSRPVVNGRPMHKRTMSSRSPNGYKSDHWVNEKPKHKYAMGMDAETKKMLDAMSKPYPRAQSIDSDVVTIQVTEGGATPTCALTELVAV